MKIASMLALCMMLGGCPYESKVAIDNPSVKINAALLGTWEDRKNADEIFIVSKHDEFTYGIEKKSKKSRKEAEKYFAFVSDVNGTTFLNLWEDKPDMDAHPYVLYKMMLKPNLITLAEVTENIDEQFATSAELKKFIAANMMNSYFYGKEEMMLIKVGD